MPFESFKASFHNTNKRNATFWQDLAYLTHIFAACMECMKQDRKAEWNLKLRLAGALISRLWASPFHRPLFQPGHKMVHGSVPAVWNPHWARGSEWVQTPSWEFSNQIESFNMSTITHTLYLPVEPKHKWWFMFIHCLAWWTAFIRSAWRLVVLNREVFCKWSMKTFAIWRLPCCLC